MNKKKPLYESQKVSEYQVKKSSACQILASILQKIEEKQQHSYISLFFKKFVKEYSSSNKVTITDKNDQTNRWSQSKSPLDKLKYKTFNRNSTSPIPKCSQSQQWKPSVQLIGHIRQSFLGENRNDTKTIRQTQPYATQKQQQNNAEELKIKIQNWDDKQQKDQNIIFEMPHNIKKQQILQKQSYVIEKSPEKIQFMNNQYSVDKSKENNDKEQIITQSSLNKQGQEQLNQQIGFNIQNCNISQSNDKDKEQIQLKQNIPLYRNNIKGNILKNQEKKYDNQNYSRIQNLNNFYLRNMSYNFNQIKTYQKLTNPDPRQTDLIFSSPVKDIENIQSSKSHLFQHETSKYQNNSTVCSPTFQNQSKDFSTSKNDANKYFKSQSTPQRKYIHENELNNSNRINIQEMVLDFYQQIDLKDLKKENNESQNMNNSYDISQNQNFADNSSNWNDNNTNNEYNNIIEYVSFEDKNKNISSENDKVHLESMQLYMQQKQRVDEQNYEDQPSFSIIKNQIPVEEDRDLKINQGMERLASVLLKKKDMKLINYMDVFVKYELFYYIITRVVNAVRGRNLLFAFMNINNFGFSKKNKFDKLNSMINNFEGQRQNKKRKAFFQIQRAALKQKVISSSAKKLMLFIKNMEEKQKKSAFHSIQSSFSVSRVFIKGQFSQYHFLAMKFQDILRKCSQRRKREALNQIIRFNLKYQQIEQIYKHNQQHKQYLTKQNYFSSWRKKFLNQQQRLKKLKILYNLCNKKLLEFFSQIMLYSKQVETQDTKKLITLRSIITIIKNKQKMLMQSSIQALQKEKQSQLSKEKIKLANQTCKYQHEQQKLQRKRAIAYRMTGIFQKLTDKRKSDAFRKIVLKTFKSSELQSKKVQKISKVFINILCSRYHKLCADAFSQIQSISNNNFISQRMGIQVLTRFLENKMKENFKSSLFTLKNHRFVSAYESKQRRTLSKSFYLMLSVKLKNIFQKRRAQYLSYSLNMIHQTNHQKLLLNKLINNIHLYHKRDVFFNMKQKYNDQRILQRALLNIQKMKNSIQKDNLFLSWNRILRNKHFKKQNVSKAIILMMTLQNIFKKCKSDVFLKLKSNNQSVKLKLRSAYRLGQKLNQIEKNKLNITFQKLKIFTDAKVKQIKRFVSILRAIYYSQMKSCYEQLYNYDFDYYYQNKEQRFYVATQVQSYIEDDFKYISPLSKRLQSLNQDQEVNKQNIFKNSNNNNNSQSQRGLMNSPSTDRTLKLNRTTPFKLSTIKIQQPVLITEEELAQRQRERYCHFSNILNRKSKIALKRLVIYTFKILCKILSKIQHRKAFQQMKEVDQKKKLAINFSNKLTKIIKQSALLPHYLHFFVILKENKMSQIYAETYRNLQISQQKKRVLELTKQGEIQIMNDVLKKVKVVSAKQKQFYVHIIHFIENLVLNLKSNGFQAIKYECRRKKIIKFVQNLNKLKNIQQRRNTSYSFSHIKNIGDILYKSKQITIFSQKISLFLSRKFLQQKYEGLFSIREHSNNLLEIYNFYEVKKNALAKIIIKQRQKHLLSSFFLWKRINKEYNIKKSLEQESVNNDLYFEVISFLNQRKNFENVIDNELKKIQNTASKTNFDSGKKSQIYDYRGQNAMRNNQYNLNNMKQNSSIRDNLDKNRSLKSSSSSFNTSTFYPDSSSIYQQEKRYDSGDFVMDNSQYQLQSQKKQLYNQFIDNKSYQAPSPQVDNQFIMCGIPILEDDEDEQTQQLQQQNKQQNQVKDNKYQMNCKKIDKIIDKYYPEASAEFSFTELESAKY